MSQFRKDIVSGEWIIIAPERAKRPHDSLPPKHERVPTPKETCPFEDLKASRNWPPYILVPDDEQEWRAAIIPNKYPALKPHFTCPVSIKEGLYEYSEGIGYHDLLVFREHSVDMPSMKHADLLLAFMALQERYRAVAKDPCLMYTSGYFNWGPSGGASLFHPHMQLVTMPIIPPQVLHSLMHAMRYFESNGSCVHCAIIAYEAEQKVRVVAENANAIAFAPFASHQPFAVKIFPKPHGAQFEATSEEVMSDLVAILQQTLASIKENLNDPDLNFFIHTAPLKNQPLYEHYHWHIEVAPKISMQAGLELSTGVLINIVEPETAAKMLRGELAE